MRRSLLLFCLLAICLAVYAAETTLTVEEVALAGTTFTRNTADYANGNTFANDGRTILILKNNHGSTTATVTVETGATLGGYAVANQDVTLAPGAEKLAGPWAPDVFNDSSGNVIISYTTATSVSVALLKVTPH